jgi:hypothetical protein
MATVLELCTAEEQRSILHFFFFLWTKALNADDICKEMFLVHGGKCLLRKEVHIWVEKYSQGRSKAADGETEVQNWLRQQSKTSMQRVSTHW